MIRIPCTIAGAGLRVLPAQSGAGSFAIGGVRHISVASLQPTDMCATLPYPNLTLTQTVISHIPNITHQINSTERCSA